MAKSPPEVTPSQMDKGHWVLAKASHSPTGGSSRSKPLSTPAFSRREMTMDESGEGMAGQRFGSAHEATRILSTPLRVLVEASSRMGWEWDSGQNLPRKLSVREDVGTPTWASIHPPGSSIDHFNPSIDKASWTVDSGMALFSAFFIISCPRAIALPVLGG